MLRGDRPTTVVQALKDGWVYEDTLPEVTKEQYDWWYGESRVIDGVRMGPPLADYPPPRLWVKLLSGGCLAAYRTDIRKDHFDGRPVHEYVAAAVPPTTPSDAAMRAAEEVWARINAALFASIPDELKQTFGDEAIVQIGQGAIPKIAAIITRHLAADGKGELARLRQAIGWICDAADAAYIENADDKRIHEIFNIAAQVAGLTRRLPDEHGRFDETSTG